MFGAIELQRSGDPAGKPRRREHPQSPGEPEILHEQLEYLIDHARNCRSQCSVCERFRVVRDAMMRLWN